MSDDEDSLRMSGSGLAMVPLESFNDSEEAEEFFLGSDSRSADGGEELHPHSKNAKHKTAWYYASFIIVGEIMGTGVMGLPVAMVHLGWIPGIFCMSFFAVTSSYSGILLSRLKNTHYPRAESFFDLARLIKPGRFAVFTDWAIWVAWGMLLPYYVMSATDSLVMAFYGVEGVCYYAWAVVLVVIMLGPIQLRSLHSMRKVALASVISVIFVILSIIIVIAAGGADPDGHTTSFPPSDTSFMTGYSHLSSFVFAFLGQSIFLEVMSDMKNPREFPKAVMMGNSVMLFVYGFTACVAYAYRGNMVPDFLPLALEDNFLKFLVGASMCYHIIVSYLLQNVLFCQKLHRVMFPHTVGATDQRGQRHWALINILVLCVAYFVANAIPFFSAFSDILGSVTGVPIMFFWPSYLYLEQFKKTNETMPKFDLYYCRMCLYVLTPVLTILGFASSMVDLVEQWESFGAPFDCDPMS